MIVLHPRRTPVILPLRGGQGPAGPQGEQGPPGDGGDAVWGGITGTLTDQTDLVSYVAAQIAAVIAAAPGALDTLDELAAALGDDANFAATIAAQLATINATLALLQPLPLSVNFSDDGEVRFRADVAMTMTQQGTGGTGTVAYEKSTAGAPSTFTSTTSPITLEAGAWLKVTATSVVDLFSVALKRTA